MGQNPYNKVEYGFSDATPKVMLFHYNGVKQHIRIGCTFGSFRVSQHTRRAQFRTQIGNLQSIAAFLTDNEHRLIYPSPDASF